MVILSWTKDSSISNMVGMVQLVSAPDCGSGYHGFESHYPPFFFFIGLSPSGKAQDFDSCIRWLEHLTFNQVVRGSNPRTLSTNAGFSK